MEIKPSRGKPVLVPPELNEAMSESQDLAEKFEQLTKGRQREFAEYIESAKREETKRKRMEKIIPMIRAGVGLHDKYRKG